MPGRRPSPGVDQWPGQGLGVEARRPSYNKGYKAVFMGSSWETPGGWVGKGFGGCLGGLQGPLCRTPGSLAHQAGKHSTWPMVRGVGSTDHSGDIAPLTPRPSDLGVRRESSSGKEQRVGVLFICMLCLIPQEISFSLPSSISPSPALTHHPAVTVYCVVCVKITVSV